MPGDSEDLFAEDSSEDSFLEWSFGDHPAPPVRRKVLSEDPLADHFEVIGELGRGGMGVVFRARDKASGREVALKILKGHLGQRQRDRFRREGELTAALRHPGIVGIHSGGELGGEPFLAYELVEGGRTLADVIDQLERPRLLALIGEVAVALGFAHAKGVVHRDVKPDNILIDPQGRPRITDFGLAWAKSLDRLSKTGALVGTPSYMAPEQFQREVGEIGPTTDVWALGAVLYRGLTGRPQFDCRTLLELQHQVLIVAPPRPRSLDSSIPADLEAVCLKALAKRPEDRYPDCRALAMDLENVVQSRPVSASSSTIKRLGFVLRRSRRSLVLGGVAVLAVTLAMGVLALSPDDSLGGADDPALRTLLVDFRQRRVGRVELERSLKALRTSDSLRARAHLALAAGEASDSAGWEVRLRHARSAASLAPTKAGPALRAEAVALEALGRDADAGAAFRRAVSVGESAALLADAARAFLAAEDGASAERAAEDLLAWRPQSNEGLRSLVRAHIAQGHIGAARQGLKALARAHPGPGAEVVRAEVAAAGGEDPRPIYARACASWPRSDEARLALVRHLFVALGEVRAAARVLEDAPASVVSWEARAVGGLLQDPIEVSALRGAPTPWQVAALRWLLREGERELAFLERLRDPRYARPPGALRGDERRRRARLSLSAALSLAEPESQLAGRAHLGLARVAGPLQAAKGDHLQRAMASLPGDPRALLFLASVRYRAGEAEQALAKLDMLDQSARQARSAVWLRARVLLALDRPAEAIPLLEELASPDRDDLLACRALADAFDRVGEPVKTSAFAERVSLLEGKRRAEASKLFEATLELEQMRLTPEEEIRAGYQAVLDLDPGYLAARYFRGRVTYTLGRRLEGLRDSFEATSRSPMLYALQHRSVQALSTGPTASALHISDLLRELEFTQAWSDRALRAQLLGASCEFEAEEGALERALVMLDGVLEERPDDVVSWTLRGFLHLRAGHRVESARDLRIALEADPDLGVIHFYMALGLAKEEAPGKDVRAELDRAVRCGFTPWRTESWHPGRYPELRGRKDDPELRLLYERRG